MSPKISIIIPVYNAEKHIEECVSSLVDQTYKDFEIVIVDDGSTDKTNMMLDSFVAKDARIRVLNINHGGASIARNAGIDVALGEFVLFVDADDLLVPEALNHIEDHLRDNIDMLWFGFLYLSSDGEITKSKKLPEIVYSNANEAVADWIRRDMLPQSACNKVYRLSVIKKFGIKFREGINFGEDRLFNIDFLAHCKSIALIPENLYIYRLREGSASHSFVPDMLSVLITQHKENLNILIPMAYDFLSPDEQLAFTNADFVKRVKSAWIHLAQYYPSLSSTEKKEGLVRFVDLEIPESIDGSNLKGLTSKWFQVFKLAVNMNSMFLLRLMMKATSSNYRKISDKS